MTEICFIRHGQTNWNRERRIQGTAETSLNKEGIRQAKKCAAYLRSQNWDIMISSPLTRAIQTATIIQHQLGPIKMIEDSDWGERDYGMATGWSYDRMIAAFRAGTVHNIETDASLRERVNRGIDHLLTHYRHKRILVVSHGVTILAALNYGFTEPLCVEHIHLKNGSLNVMTHNGNQWKVCTYNHVNHLRTEA